VGKDGKIWCSGRDAEEVGFLQGCEDLPSDGMRSRRGYLTAGRNFSARRLICLSVPARLCAGGMAPGGLGCLISIARAILCQMFGYRSTVSAECERKILEFV
jgi:hypothetical protein